MPNTALPVWKYRDELLDAILRHPVLVVLGETGSGKTTQIPQYILNCEQLKCRRIAVTQPRRIAAVTVARRVAEEVGCSLRETVGYTVRFDDCTSERTRLRYMTDGVLLREAVVDPTLAQYDLVIVDEAHERTLDTDVLVGLLKRARRKRPELRVLVMSATLDPAKFSDFHDGCPVFSIPGRMFPVEILHHADSKISSLRGCYAQRAVETALHIHKSEEPGDVLVFLTGGAEIENACRQLAELERNISYRRDVRFCNDVTGLTVLPVYGSLETMEQRAIFERARPGHRKVVFSTNIAQTSVTIPNIRYVVDSGFVKQKTFEPQTGMDALVVVPISQAAAAQRAGRAGRTQPGRVYRLYSRGALEMLDEETVPEIKRSSLVGIVLDLKVMGITDMHEFEFLDPPDITLVNNGLRQLFLLGALNRHGVVTDLGRKMAAFPLPPGLSRSVIAASEDWHCGEEMLTIVSVLASEDIYTQPRSEKAQLVAAHARSLLHHTTGDHLTLLNIYEAWDLAGCSNAWCAENFVNQRALHSARKIRSQLAEICRSLNLPIVHVKRLEARSVSEHPQRWRESANGGNGTKPGRHDRRVASDESSTAASVHRRRRRFTSPPSRRYSRHRRLSTGSVSPPRHRPQPVDEPDPTPILRAMSAGFYTNTAKRHHGAVFCHYPSSPDFLKTISAAASASPTGASPAAPALDIASQAGFIPLNVSPNSALDPHGRVAFDWIVYHDVTVVAGWPVMRHVSRVDKEWVLEDLRRIALVDIARLAAGKEAAEEEDRSRRIDGAAAAERERADREAAGRESARVAAEKRAEREKEIEAARMRYLERRKSRG